MSDDIRLRPESAEWEEEDFRPSEWENAFLSLALFGGLILFGIGCFVFGWN